MIKRPPVIDGAAIRCCGEVIRGAGDVRRPGNDGDGDGFGFMFGLNGFSSAGCEWGVPIRGD